MSSIESFEKVDQRIDWGRDGFLARDLVEGFCVSRVRRGLTWFI